MILINMQLVQSTDLSPVRDLNFAELEDFDRLTEHYPLLGYLSLNYPDGSKFLDIGTRRGASAIAMSLNPNIHVDSYDINDYGCGDRIKANNISFHIANIFNDLTQVLEYDVILMDIEPHDGKKETILINYLKNNQWQGILILDDIAHIWKDMRKLWENVPEDLKKYNVTQLAHASGTGIIDYGNNIQVEI